MGKFIFRKIGGRIIPIRITNVKDAVAQASSFGTKYRNVVAKLPDGQQVAKMALEIPKKGKHANVLSVNVEKKFQKKGISKALFQRATEFLERAGLKSLRSNDIQHVAQVKIRSQYGSYLRYLKNGIPKIKNRTKYFADQFPPFGESTRRITKQQAIDFIKQNKTPRSTGRQISATTFLKKRKK